MFTLASERSTPSNIPFLINMDNNFINSNKGYLTFKIHLDALKQLAEMIPWTSAMDHVA